MNSSPCATLVLKTSDLTAGSTTSIGSMDAMCLDMTWYNINLRVLLGDMYDKYDRFNLCLNSMATSVAGNAPAAGTNPDDRFFLINLSGLPFVNSTYNQSTNHNSSSIVLKDFNIWPLFANTYYSEPSCKQFTFTKQEVCNIRINYTKISDGAIPTTTRVFPSLIFIFEIYSTF